MMSSVHRELPQRASPADDVIATIVTISLAMMALTVLELVRGSKGSGFQDGGLHSPYCDVVFIALMVSYLPRHFH
jgi:hypothetical protein